MEPWLEKGPEGQLVLVGDPRSSKGKKVIVLIQTIVVECIAEV